MTDEEKQAIAYLKFYIERDVMYEETHYTQIRILLNLIEKQQKEIKILKESQFVLYDHDGYIAGCIRLGNDVISKDKIKAKIDLIDKEYAEFIEKNKNDLDLVNINAQRHNAMQTILEELLGGTDGKD